MIQFLLKKQTKIQLWDGIEDFPHRNYMKFNKEMMRANEVGSSPSDIMKRIGKALSFNKHGQKDKVAKELTNAQLAYNYMMNEIDPEGLALAALTKSIGGVPCDDFTTSGLMNTLEKLQDLGITKKQVTDYTQTVKKNLSKNSKFSFLKTFLGRISRSIRR